MKSFITPTFHGVINYIVTILLILSPWLFNFYHVGGASLITPVFFGWVLLIMTIFTDFKPGFIKVLPLLMHCFLQMMAGFIILVSPFLYAFSDQVYLPHLILGLIMFIVAVFDQKSPFINEPHVPLKEAGITSLDAHEGRMMV